MVLATVGPPNLSFLGRFNLNLLIITLASNRLGILKKFLHNVTDQETLNGIFAKYLIFSEITQIPFFLPETASSKNFY
jgi:hypothetical protein